MLEEGFLAEKGLCEECSFQEFKHEFLFLTCCLKAGWQKREVTRELPPDDCNGNPNMASMHCAS